MTKSNPLQTGWAIYLYSSDQTTQRRHLATIQQNLLTASDLPILYEFADLAIWRADYQRLLTAARSGAFSHLAVTSLASLGHDAQQVGQTIAEFQQLGIAVRIADLPHLKFGSADDQLLIAAYFALSHYYARRVRQGLAAKRAANQKGDHSDE